MADRLDGLLHDAVIGGDDQHDDIGDIGAARAHRGKGLMAGRIDKGDLLAAPQADAVGADMLRDAAGFAAGDIGLAQRVEQRGLAVVDMAHDGDHRRARLERLGQVLLAAQPDLDIGLGDAPQAVSELGDDQLGGVGVDDLVDRRHHAHAHQRFDDVGGAFGHAVGQFLDGDRLGNDHLAHDLDLLLLAVMQPLALALSRPADRGQAAHPLSFVAGERAGDRHLSGPAAHVFAAHRRHRLLDLGTGAPPRRRRRLLFLLDRNGDLARRSQRRHLCGRRLAGPLSHLAPRFLLLAPLRLLFGSLAGLLFGAAARLFLFDLLARFLLGPPARLLSGALFFLPAPIRFGESRQSPRFLVGLARILHGPGAPRPFLRSQRAGNHDRAARRLLRLPGAGPAARAPPRATPRPGRPRAAPG